MNYAIFRGFWISAQKPHGDHKCAARRCIMFCPVFRVLLWTAWR